MSLLVLGAWEPELERFRALEESPRSKKDVAGNLNIEAVGIGPVDAALGTARSLVKHRPTLVLLLGTAGAYVGGDSIGDVIVAGEVLLLDPSSIEGKAAMPYAAEPLALDRDLASRCVAAGARGPRRVANTLGVTTDSALARSLAIHADVEHLEAYAVARACHQAGVRCAILLGISNVVGPSGREEWRQNHRGASASAADVAERFVRGLALA